MCRPQIPGWSCLFLAPLNRPNGIFDIVAGIVDTDANRAPIHFPFCATGPDALHEIAMGSPVVQVIPSRRETRQIEADIRSETDAEAEDRDRVRRQTDAAPGWSRDNAPAKRRGRARRLLACRPFVPRMVSVDQSSSWFEFEDGFEELFELELDEEFDELFELELLDEFASEFELELDDPLPRLSSSSLRRQLRVSNRISPLRAVRSR